MITHSIYIVRVSTLFFLLTKKVMWVQRQLSSDQRASADSGFVSRDALFLGVLSSAGQCSLPFPQQPVVHTSALFTENFYKDQGKLPKVGRITSVGCKESFAPKFYLRYSFIFLIL